MRIFAWNCRGIGESSAIRDLRALLRSSSPDVLILMEMKANPSTMHGFCVTHMRNTMENLGMITIPSSSFSYTWTNHRRNHGLVNSRIDRGVANEDWWRLFPNASILILPRTTFDHNPQVLHYFGQQYFAKRPFRFEAAWVEDQRSHWVVHHSWRSKSHPWHPTRLLNRMQASRTALSQWNKNQFGNIQSNIRTTRAALSALQESPDPDNEDRKRNLPLHLNHLLNMEEILWFQKSILNWQLDGDRCTRFFFLTTLSRRKHNRIDCIKSEDGQWLSTRNQIGQAFMQRFMSIHYYKNWNIR
ncbi:hypothetical protein UlMin_033761 [Ulmus minor]